MTQGHTTISSPPVHLPVDPPVHVPVDVPGGNRGPFSGTNMARPVDWICPNCQELVFARNARCRKCAKERPSPVSSTMEQPSAPASSETRPGDWMCPNCQELVFARNPRCRKCAAKRSSAALSAAQRPSVPASSEMRPGDWMSVTTWSSHEILHAGNADPNGPIIMRFKIGLTTTGV